MKKLICILIVFLSFVFVTAQNVTNPPLRYIEVTGSAEMYVEPDEIVFSIQLKEYWIEEFTNPNNPKKFKNKVLIEELERDLFKTLAQIGIQKEQILINNIGNSWRSRGQELLFTKDYEISITNFAQIDSLFQLLNKKGVEHIYIKEFKNKQITEFRKQVKIMALQAAKDKATYLLESIGKNCGDVILIQEIEENNYINSRSNSNVHYYDGESNDENSEKYRKIVLKYQIKAQFEIK